MRKPQTKEPLPEQQRKDLADEERREALKKLGVYAAYTAPAMLALLLPKKCLAESPRP
jgi:hypothetical protein